MILLRILHQNNNVKNLLSVCLLFVAITANAQFTLSPYAVASVGGLYGYPSGNIKPGDAGHEKQFAGFIRAGAGAKWHFESPEKICDIHTELTAYIAPVNGNTAVYAAFHVGPQIPITESLILIPMPGVVYSFGGVDPAKFSTSISTKIIFDLNSKEMFESWQAQAFIQPVYQCKNFFVDFGFIIHGEKL